MRRFLLAGKALLLAAGLNAQAPAYTPLQKDAAREKSLQDALAARYSADLSSLSGENKKYIAEIYKERLTSIQDKFRENEIITDPAVTGYLQAVCQQILKANPTIKAADLRVLFSRAWWPNASSMGEGTILFNIGLFNRLSSESEVAFVLCHELAHYLLNHGNNSIARYVNTLYSDDFQKKLKEIQKSEYRRNQQVEALAKNFAFRSRRHGREFEHAADSMGLELLKNTGYDLNGALSCLALLDSVDKDKFGSTLELSRTLDFAEYRFKKSWTQSGSLMYSVVREGKTAEDDSLKTHPDCKLRVHRLAEAVQRYNKPSNRRFLVSEADFTRLVDRFDAEVLAYSFESKQVTQCLYAALKMAAARPRQPFPQLMAGRSLNAIYTAQKKHELGRIADMPGPQHSEDYNTLLQLVQNLRLTEIAALSYFYLKQASAVCGTEAEYATLWAEARANYGQ